MKYTREEFFRLMEAIEADGGEHLDKVHEHSNYLEFVGGPTKDVAQSYHRNCGESALFEVDYQPIHGDTLERMEVCAVDDWMGRWPRFASADAAGEN